MDPAPSAPSAVPSERCVNHGSRGTACTVCGSCVRCPVPPGSEVHKHRTGNVCVGRPRLSRDDAGGSETGGSDDEAPESKKTATSLLSVPGKRIVTHLLRAQGPDDPFPRHFFPVFYDRHNGNICVDVDESVLNDRNWLSPSAVRMLEKHLAAIEDLLPLEVFLRPGKQGGQRKRVTMTLRAFVRWIDVHLTRVTIIHPVLWTFRMHLLTALYDEGCGGMTKNTWFVDDFAQIGTCVVRLTLYSVV